MVALLFFLVTLLFIINDFLYILISYIYIYPILPEYRVKKQRLIRSDHKHQVVHFILIQLNYLLV